MTLLLAQVFTDFLSSLKDPSASDYTTLLDLPWILKPLFGFLADWLYPFYYRTKGYMVIIGILNVAFSFLSIYYAKEASDNAKDINSKYPMIFFFCMLFIFMCLAAVDSICRKKELYRKHDFDSSETRTKNQRTPKRKI